MTRRVVITGMGTVNPLSLDLKGYWEGLCAGRSGIAPILQLDTSAFRLLWLLTEGPPRTLR